MTHHRFPTLLAIVVPALTACGSPTDADGPVTEREARELVQGLHLVDSFRTREDAWACPLGGEMLGVHYHRFAESSLIAGSYLTYAACRVRVGFGTYTLDGELNGEVWYGLDRVGRIVSVEGFHTGNVHWRRGSRSASCDLDLTSASTDDDVLTITGTACGIRVEVEMSVRPE